MTSQKPGGKDIQNISVAFPGKKLTENLIQGVPFILRLVFVFFIFSCHSIYTLSQDDQIEAKSKMQDDYYQIYEKAKFYQQRADSTLKITQMLRKELFEEKDTEERKLLEKRILKSEKQHTGYVTNANTYYEKAAHLKNIIDLSNQTNRMAETRAYSDAFYKLPLISNLLNAGEWNLLYKLEPSALIAEKIMADISNLKNKKDQLAIISSTTQIPGEKDKLKTQIENLDSEIEEKEKEAFLNLQKVYMGKYEVNKGVLNRIINQAGAGEQRIIHDYKTNAELSLKKSVNLHKKANDTSDKEAEFKLLGESNTYALLAIETQKKALGIYTGTLTESSTDHKKNEQKTIALSESKGENISGELESETSQTKKTKKNVDTLMHINKFKVNSDSGESNNFSISIDEPLPKGVIYKIQIGVYKNLQSKTFFKGIWPVSAETIPSSNNLRFLVGMFSSFTDARAAIDSVKKTGFKDAFIIAYYNQGKISVKEARNLEKQSGTDKAQQIITPVFSDPAEDRNNSGNETIVLTIQIGAFHEKIPVQRLKELNLYAENEEIKYFQNKKGLYVYTIGNFSNFEKAVFFKNGLIEKGLSGAYVIALKEDQKIPLDEAIPMMK